MCGIAGLFDWENQFIKTDLQKMSGALQHRGPDDGDHWIDTKQSLGLTHRRLSILDLSSAGRQPMQSLSKRYTMVYNGEIYNYKSLLNDLKLNQKDHDTWGDSRVLIECIDIWGLDKTLKKISKYNYTW